MNAAFLDIGSLGPADIDMSGLTATLPDLTLYDSTTPAELPQRIAGREILLINKVHLDRDLLAASDKLKLVCLAATGSDNVDLQAARELGIAVCNIRNYCGPSVIQHVFALLLALTVRLVEYRSLLATGAWQRSPHFCLLDFPSRELAGRVFAIIGYGHLGKGVADVARALGMRVVAVSTSNPASAVDTGVDRLALPELLACADVVSLHCPLTPATRHLINADSLRLMRRDSVLINTARGGLVDGDALLRALRAGAIGGAGIDVLPEEPPWGGDCLLEATLPNLIVTPHIAWAAREARQRALDEVNANVRDFLAGGQRNRLV